MTRFPRLPGVFAAMLAITAILPAPARAQDICTQMFIYAVNQVCRWLPNGQSLCQPVALTGPAPACEVPADQRFKPVPLAPPTLSPMPPVAMPAPVPYTPPFTTPFTPPYGAPPFQVNPVSPYAPAWPGAAGVNPYLAAPTPMTPPSMPAPTVIPPAPTAAKPAIAAPAVTPVVMPPQPDAPASKAASQPPAAPPAVEATAATAAPIPVESQPQLAVAPTLTSASVAPQPPASSTPPHAPATEPAPASATKAEVVIEDALAHFAFDSAELTEAGRAMLDVWLTKAPVGMPVVVTGYADRLGPEPYNVELSMRRAESVRAYLISKGKDGRDIRASVKGEADPVKRCKGGPTPDTKACLAPNRRVEITHD